MRGSSPSPPLSPKLASVKPAKLPLGSSSSTPLFLSPWLLAAVVSLAFGCNKSKPSEASRKAPTSAESAHEQASKAEPTLNPALEASVKKWLEGWVASQNAGDFAAYEKLYARRFTGLKKVGTFERRFDRAGWLKDRAGMFKRPVSVQVADLRILGTRPPLLVEFQQTWSSGTYRDVGRKRLQLIDEGGLKITTEALLESTLKVPTALAAHKPEEFSWVTQLATSQGLILESGVELNAVHGSPLYISDERLERPVLSKALPARYQSLLGRAFKLYAGSGKSCTARVVGFKVLVEAVPHFGMVQAWNGMADGVNTGAVKASPAERALALWRLSEAGGRFLVAELDAPCPEGLWARAETLPAPKLWSSRALSQDELSAAKKFVRRSADYRALQADFVAAFAKSVPWDETGAASERSRAFEDEAGRTYYSLLLRSGEDDGCASAFDVDRWFLLQKQANGLVVVSAPEADHAAASMPRVFAPVFAEHAVDLDGDGEPEFLGTRDLMRHQKNGFTVLSNLSGAFYDCGC